MQHFIVKPIIFDAKDAMSKGDCDQHWALTRNRLKVLFMHYPFGSLMRACQLGGMAENA
jgi:hypothetical protein